MITRVGIGFDIHRLTKGGTLILGGVAIPSLKGTLAHSDGDVLLHALCDALLGAILEKDIGHHFPESNPKYRNTPSSLFVTETMKMVKKKKFHVISMDSIIVLQKPTLQPFIDNMTSTLKKLLKTHSVSVKAKTHEKLGDIGKGNAVSSTVIVCLGK